MVTLKCIAELKKPAHVGFGTGRQVRDLRRKPFVPSIVLTTQISTLSLRLAKSVNRPTPSIKVSDGFLMGKEKIVKVRGQEFFQGQIAFQVQVPEDSLDIVLGALKLLQNFGIGANTSMGFGYCSIKVVGTSIGKSEEVIPRLNPKATDLIGDGEFSLPSPLVRLAQQIFNRLKMNWSSWFKAMETGRIERIVYLAGETEIKNPFAYRGWLRSRLLELWGIEHESKVTVCPPRVTPCKVCRLMGRMSEKSRMIVRTFEKKGDGASVWLIVDNPNEEELEALKKVAGAKVVRVETISDYLP
ncbi:hypothetical protein Q2T83_18270 (plasmid) [Fervidibacter sacchari]|uniref:Uncharacterized protein n=1 Tax=Candidatus Fervidibacter sacchari TaxID=1448929 RepID=A0ABT2EWK6_9BACT|nr:hypothetical protein [Candidatus Fervidibacter sacchari]MCS3921298.1 hypothetical protein [Candidatus Fervidibacter sacchari]WKU18103.1 hypothetical protein Q2T83_18270 [Candidatus Fervidibacter sacchari]